MFYYGGFTYMESLFMITNLIRTSDTRYFVNPFITAVASEIELNDLNTFGFILNIGYLRFKSLYSMLWW